MSGVLKDRIYFGDIGISLIERVKRLVLSKTEESVDINSIDPKALTE